MSNELVERLKERSGLEASRLPTRVPRAVVKRVERAGHRALEASAIVQGAAYVTHVAMREVGALTAEEGHLIQQTPLVEPRLQAMVDTYAGLCCAEIARLGR